MFTRIIGDIHGLFNDYTYLTKRNNFDGSTIQVGDFGIGFGQGKYWHEKIDNFHGDKHKFIRGNHDNPAMCKTMKGWIPDGTVQNDTMFIGGAWSIDHAYRRQGIDWWDDEECSMEELLRMYDVYKLVHPTVMITHDAPTEVTNEMFIKSGLAMGGSNAKLIKTRTGQALQAMLEEHQPKHWFFGHWHHTMEYTYGGTKFHCLGEFDYADFDLDNLEYA